MKFKSALRDIVGGVLIGVPVTATVLDFFGYVAKVEGFSMQPTLNPENANSSNDYVLLNRWSVRSYDVHRGDVIALASPRDPDQRIIKRVIALEGDTVKTLHYKKRYVNIPQGHCWVEGDHHRHSMDSNFFGPVALGLITAKASHIVWPPRRWQRLSNELPAERSPTKIVLRNRMQDWMDGGDGGYDDDDDDDCHDGDISA